MYSLLLGHLKEKYSARIRHGEVNSELEGKSPSASCVALGRQPIGRITSERKSKKLHR